MLEFLDLPLLTGLEAAHALRLAAYADPWPGSVAVYKSPSTSGYVRDSVIGTAAVIGRTDADLFSGPVGRWDSGSVLFVTLFGGTLESRDDLAVLGGANAAVVGNPGGDWEVIQFANAELIGPSQYKLTRLLRGQAGTERAMADPLTAGARFVLLDGAIVESEMTPELRGLPLNWRYGPASRALDDFTYQTVTLTAQGIGLRPYSPAQVSGSRDAGTDDLTIRWVRRTRTGGDSWEQTEVPLGEDAELYEIDILDAGQVVRTLQSSVPNVIYTAAQQDLDFAGGAPVAPLDIAIYQLSTIFGRGSAREVTLNV